MPCFSPVRGFRGADGGVVAARGRSPTQTPTVVPCGRCLGCRLDRAQEWSIRIAHEARLHDDSVFLTLTYRDEDLPGDYSVSLPELQRFFKRLRKAIEPCRVRYFACGEYGDVGLRPHYHVILFGYGFPDRKTWRFQRGLPIYRSELLESLWTCGNSEIGTVTRQSGGYVARYCLKKISGDLAEDHYKRVHPLTGELVEVRREFAVMSKRPGLGSGWLDRYEGDAFPSGFVVCNGRRLPVPRFYRKRLKGRFSFGQDVEDVFVKDDLELATAAVKRRFVKLRASSGFQADQTDERLLVREECARLRANRLKRELE